MAQITGQGPIIAGGSTSEVFTTPFPHRVGTRARDENGNEYIFLDFTGTVYIGQPVLISDDGTAAAVGTTGRGRVGVVTASGTSNNAGWVQVYGRARMMVGMSAVTVSEALQTTVNTSVQTLFRLATSLTTPAGMGWTSDPSLILEGGLYLARGITVATDASPSDVSDNLTSLTSVTVDNTTGHIGVFLNFPTLEYMGHYTS